MKTAGNERNVFKYCSKYYIALDTERGLQVQYYGMSRIDRIFPQNKHFVLSIQIQACIYEQHQYAIIYVWLAWCQT